ncbi:MAG: GNAT family N-acetyltransferase [Candidatus Izemoplasmataceae bacterium]
MFLFKNFTRLSDQEIELILEKTLDEDIEKDYLPSYQYVIKLKDTNDAIGSIDIRIGFNKNIHYGGNIGYFIEEAYRGNYYASKACRLLKPVALAHDMKSLRITCNPDNIASRKSIESVGGILLGIIDLPEDNEMYQQGERQKCLYDWYL